MGFSAITLALRLLPVAQRLQRSQSLAKSVGRIWSWVDRAGTELTRKNFEAVWGDSLSESDIEAMVQDVYRIIARHKIINDILPDLSLEQLSNFLPIKGLSHLQAGLEGGKGVILLGSHLGLHGFVLLMLLKRLGYRYTAVVSAEIKPHDSWVYKNIVYPIRSRAWHHFNVIDPDGTPQREMLQCLRNNEIMIICGDTLEDDALTLTAPQGLRAPFLGHSLPLKTGPYRLSRWVNAPVIPFFIIPGNNDEFTMIIEPPINLSASNSIDGLLADVTQYSNRLESYVLQYPTYWGHWRHDDLIALLDRSAPDVKQHSQVFTSSSKRESAYK